MKQSKLRRRRVIRFAILYFVLLIVFLALVVGPAVAGSKILGFLPSALSPDKDLMGLKLIQPNQQNHDNTNSSVQTGTGAPDYTGALLTMSRKGGKASATDDDASFTGKIKLF